MNINVSPRESRRSEQSARPSGLVRHRNVPLKVGPSKLGPSSALLPSLLLVAGCLMLSGCGSPPALESPEARKAADALHTAITSRRPELVSAAEKRMQELADRKLLSADAHDEFKAAIELTRRDEWLPAAKRIDAMIRGQKTAIH